MIYYSGLSYLIEFLCKRLEKDKVVILTYHRIIPEKFFNQRVNDILKLGMTPLNYFEKQMQFLSRKNILLRMEDIYCHSRIPRCRRGVIITFDDGHRDFYAVAYPIIKKYSIPATLFITAGYIGTPKTFWWDDIISFMISSNSITEFLLSKLYVSEEIKGKIRNLLKNHQNKTEVVAYFINEIKKLPPEEREKLIKEIKTFSSFEPEGYFKDNFLMSWEEVREISNNGISIGSHSLTHPILSHLSEKDASWEIKASRDIIEEKLDKEVKFFSYPFGRVRDFNKEIKRLVKENGYICACSSEAGTNTVEESDLFELRRKMPDEFLGFNGRFSQSTFALEIGGFYDFFRRILYKN